MNAQAIPKSLWNELTDRQRSLPVHDADKQYNIIIDKSHVKKACGHQKDGRHCVVAQAFRELPSVRDVYIGATRSFLIFDDQVVRYVTSATLRDALKVWDVTGNWRLKAGVYKLRAITPSDRKEYIIRANKTHALKKRVGLTSQRSYTPNPRRLFAAMGVK